MNFRQIILRYVGWCPGVKTASKFLPNREIPSTQVAMMLALASMISLSGYYITNMALSTVGFPSYGDMSIIYENPILAVRGNEIYLAEIVRIGSTLDFGTRYTLILAKMSLEGGVSDVVTLVDTQLLLNYDMLVTKDGRFHLAYTQNALTEIPRKLIALEANDGRDWDETVLEFSDYLAEHSLTETKDGRPFLFIASIEKLQQSGDIGPPKVEYFFSTYSDDEWAPFEARARITNVEYREPNLLYSTKRDGFYLAHASQTRIYPTMSTQRTVHITFSKDLVEWEDVVDFQPGSDPSMAQLPDGTLVVAFKNAHSAQEIHFSKSIDGINWTKPQKVEDIPIDAILGKVVSWRRLLVSSFSGASLGIFTFIALVRRTRHQSEYISIQ